MTTSADQITPDIVAMFKQSVMALGLELPEAVWKHHANLAEQLITELEQLRAEREGLLQWIDGYLQAFEQQEWPLSELSLGKVFILNKAKSQLTRAQTRTDGEGE